MSKSIQAFGAAFVLLQLFSYSAMAANIRSCLSNENTRRFEVLVWDSNDLGEKSGGYEIAPSWGSILFSNSRGQVICRSYLRGIRMLPGGDLVHFTKQGDEILLARSVSPLPPLRDLRQIGKTHSVADEHFPRFEYELEPNLVFDTATLEDKKGHYADWDMFDGGDYSHSYSYFQYDIRIRDQNTNRVLKFKSY